MIAILYTDTDAVRACLGVSEREISDAQITGVRMEDQLLESLEDVLSTHETVYADGIASYATSDQLKQLRRLRLFCQYECAVILLPQLQNLIAQKVTDSDAEMQRFMKDDLDRTKDQIIAMRNKYRGLLNTDFDSTEFMVSPVVTVTPTYDPVTDE